MKCEDLEVWAKIGRGLAFLVAMPDIILHRM